MGFFFSCGTSDGGVSQGQLHRTGRSAHPKFLCCYSYFIVVVVTVHAVAVVILVGQILVKIGSVIAEILFLLLLAKIESLINEMSS